MPTVVVARTPAPGREVEFEQWLRRLVAAARSFPGHVHSDIQPPTDVHPGEWVILYQFADADSLTSWFASEQRQAIMAQGDELVVGTTREQVIALGSQPEPVTAVSSFRIRPGNERDYASLHVQVIDALVAFPGFLRAELFDPVPGVQDTTVVVFSFDNREHLDAWLQSDARRHLLAQIDPLTDGDRTVNIVGGFAGWFGAEGAPQVKRWKQAVVVLVAIAPITLVITALRRWVLPDVHWVVGTLIGNVIGIAALTWLLMPRLTKLLAGWLAR